MLLQSASQFFCLYHTNAGKSRYKDGRNTDKTTLGHPTRLKVSLLIIH